ncbi:unnamed protein product, partial [Didymodactylos carnosus]
PLPSQQSKRYKKPELDRKRLDLLNEAVRSQFRISKHHYPTFYKEIIQQTLADCLYNEGPRKEKRQTVQQQQQTLEQPVTTPATAPITSHHHPMIIIRLMIIIQSDKDI